MSGARRFYVAPADVADDRLVLRADEAHHARRVLRLGPGDAVVCFDGEGRAWRGRIAGYERDAALVAPVEALPVEPEPRPRVTLAQGLLKGERMELVVQKATELGAARLLPLAAERSAALLDEARSARRLERWRRIALEAAKQCERARLPALSAPIALSEALDGLDGPAVAFVERDGAPARPALAALAGSPALTVFVGPEGGWSAAERAALAGRGVAGLSLGPRVLRAETAAVAALAVVAYELSSV